METHNTCVGLKRTSILDQKGHSSQGASAHTERGLLFYRSLKEGPEAMAKSWRAGEMGETSIPELQWMNQYLSGLRLWRLWLGRPDCLLPWALLGPMLQA